MNNEKDQIKKFAWLPVSVIACRKDPRKTKQIIWLEHYYEETEFERLKIPNKAAALANIPSNRLYYHVAIRVKYWDKE